MIHDLALVDRLAALPTDRFGVTVYRAPITAADPLAASTSSGRWAPPQTGEPGVDLLDPLCVVNGSSDPWGKCRVHSPRINDAEGNSRVEAAFLEPFRDFVGLHASTFCCTDLVLQKTDVSPL